MLWPRGRDMEDYMSRILSLLGYTNGNNNTGTDTITLQKSFMITQYLEPDELKFIALCMYRGIRGIDAIDMVLAADTIT